MLQPPKPGVEYDADKKGKIMRIHELTAQDEAACAKLLETYNWDLERAVQEFFSK
jgi:hypothetical protein